MPYKEHHKYERGMKDARYDIDEVEDFPRGDTWEEAEAEYHWDTCVQMDMERRVEQGDVAEVPEVTVAESAAVVDRTQAAEEAREAERQRHKQWLVEREEQRRAALVELASLAEAIAECPLCPLVSLDRLDAGTLRALYARHEHEQHDREEEETQAADKKAAPEDGEDEYSGVVEPVRVRPDGTPVFDINALPVDVWGVLMYYLDPYSLIQVCYASNWLRVLAEDCGAWEMCWRFMRLTPRVRLDSRTSQTLWKVEIRWDHYSLQQANKGRDAAISCRVIAEPIQQWIRERRKREQEEKAEKIREEHRKAAGISTPSTSDDDLFFNLFGSDSDDTVAPPKPAASSKPRTTTANGFSTHNNQIGQALEGENSALYLLDNPMKGGRAFPWSVFLSFRHRLYSCVENEWEEWLHVVNKTRSSTSSWGYYYTPTPTTPSTQYCQPCHVVKDSLHHQAIHAAVLRLQKGQGRLGAIANLELYRQATKQETRLFAAYRANLAAGMLHTASDYFEQVDFSKIPENTKLMLGAPRTEAAFAAARSELSMRCLDVMAEDEVDVATQDYSVGAAKLFVKVGRETKNRFESYTPRLHKGLTEEEAEALEAKRQKYQHRNWYGYHHQNAAPAKKEPSTKASRAQKQAKNVRSIGQPTTEYEKLKLFVRNRNRELKRKKAAEIRQLLINEQDKEKRAALLAREQKLYYGARH